MTSNHLHSQLVPQYIQLLDDPPVVTGPFLGFMCFLNTHADGKIWTSLTVTSTSVQESMERSRNSSSLYLLRSEIPRVYLPVDSDGAGEVL